MWFCLSILDFSILPDQWWVSFLDISFGSFNGAMVHIEHDNGYWKFDLLYLRTLVHWLQDYYR